ncbi:hypothetical protein BKA70DRAFT_251105 [Coprinopsis sp. MPI-PUGE-AT-0042]|nr:hypothetical protein BKA70DRAFT_251105 [Coprinopsis sp. MPI-PUGE-AT-0042]
MQTALQICDLPLDILLGIFHAADGLDVVSLRQTCKTLHSIEKQFHDNIWRYHHLQLCLESGIFHPTFSGWTGPSSNWEEFVVARAELMRAMLRNRQTSFMEKPLHSRFKELQTQQAGTVHCVSVLPGGRFVVLISLDRLCIWDFKTCSKNEMSTPVLLLDQVISACNSAEVFAAPESRALTDVGIVLHHSRVNHRHPQAQYFESRRYCQIRFCGSNPLANFSRVGEIQINVDISSQPKRFEGRSEDSLCIVFGSDLVLLWNFIAGKYAIWTLPGSNLYDNVLISQEHIVFSSSKVGRISRTSIPALHLLPSNGIIELLPGNGHVSLDLIHAQMQNIFDPSSLQPGIWSSPPWGGVSTLDGLQSPVQVQWSEGTGLLRSEWRHLSDGSSNTMKSTPAKRFVHRFPLNTMRSMDSGVQRVGSSRSVITCSLWETFEGQLQFHATLSQFPTNSTTQQRRGTDGYHVPLLYFKRRSPMVWDFCPLAGILVVVFANDRSVCAYDFVGSHFSSPNANDGGVSQQPL